LELRLLCRFDDRLALGLGTMWVSSEAWVKERPP